MNRGGLRVFNARREQPRNPGYHGGNSSRKIHNLCDRHNVPSGSLHSCCAPLFGISIRDEHDSARRRYSFRLYKLSNKIRKREFLKRLRPIPIFKPKIHFFRELREPDPERPADWCDISLELVGVEHAYHIDRYREKAIDWAATLATIAEDLTTLLAEAMDWLQEFGLASAEEDRTHIEYRSVSEHSQNKHAHTWTQLIALTRMPHL